MEDKKEFNPIEDNSNAKLKIRESHIFYLEKNLAAIDPEYIKKVKQAIVEGKDTKEIIPNSQTIIDILEAKEKKVPVDTDISISGCKNPLVTIFIGFSTRGLFDAIKRKKKKVENIFIIEPDIEVFKHLLMTEDVSDLLANPKYEFIVGIDPEALLPTLFKTFSVHDKDQPYSRMTRLQNMERIQDPFTFNEKKEVFKRIDEVISETMKHVQLSMGCSDDQFRRWEMMFENKNIMLNAHSIEPLYGKFSDVPIIVCGGGPSLDDFIKEYKKNKNIVDNSLIIAVDAVLHKLLTNGIKPHIVTRCERKLTGIFKGVTKEMTKGIYYAAYPWTPKEFFDLFDNHFYLFRANGVCVFTEVKEHGTVNGGVSSGNAALELALLLGSKNIMLTGIDMCEIDGNTHIDGTQVEFNIKNSKKKSGSIKIKCNDGEERETIPVWVRCFNEYYQSIEKHRSKGKKFKVYNTSFKGLAIRESEYKPWKKLKKLFEKNVDTWKMIEDLKGSVSDESKKRFIEKVEETRKMLLDVKETLIATESLVKDAERTCDRECDKLVKFLSDEYEGFTLYEELRKQEVNFEKLWFNVMDAIDHNFKNKWLTNMEFRIMFLDVLQLDTFFYENQVQSIINLIDNNSSKYKQYVTFTKGWLRKIRHYTEEFLRAIEETK